MLFGGAYADAHAMGFGHVMVQDGNFLASDLIGMRICNSETEMHTNAMVADGAEAEWDDIGEINDVIISQDGNVTAVIQGVGGFLGMGERDVSASMDAIKVVKEEGDSGDRFLVVTTSKEILEQAPEFDRNLDGEMAADEETVAVTESTQAEATATEMAPETVNPRSMLTRPLYQREAMSTLR